MSVLDWYRLLISGTVFMFFIAAGSAFLLLPTTSILKWDRKAGYWLYKTANSPERGLLFAGALYKVFGVIFLTVALFGVLPAVLK